MYCPNCGTEIKIDDLYCPNCGTKIRNEELQNEVKKEEAVVHENDGTIKTISIILMIITIVSYGIASFFLVSKKNDPLFIDTYLKPYSYIVPMVIGSVCLSFGIIFKRMKYRVLRNIIAGAIVLGISFNTFVSITQTRLRLDRMYETITEEEYSAYKTIIPELPSDDYYTKAIKVDYNDENKIIVYGYIKSNSELTTIKNKIATSDNWKELKNSNIGDYYLVYNTKTLKYNDFEESGDLVFVIYNSEFDSFVIVNIPSTFSQYFSFM